MYHQAIGIEKFYIFDDNSSVPVAAELQDLMQQGGQFVGICQLRHVGLLDAHFTSQQPLHDDHLYICWARLQVFRQYTVTMKCASSSATTKPATLRPLQALSFRCVMIAGLLDCEPVGPLPNTAVKPQLFVYDKCIQRFR